jgi:hypothetical protein
MKTQQQSNWSRSYHNPVGSVYHAPSESDDRWATWDRKPSPADNLDSKELPRNYPLGYGLLNHMDTYGRRKPGIGLGAFLPRPMASQTPMGASGYNPMPGGYSPYVGASPQGSQIHLSDRLKQGSFSASDNLIKSLYLRRFHSNLDNC